VTDHAELIERPRERLRRAVEDGERLYRVRMHAPDGPTIADDNRIDGILTFDLTDALGAYERLAAALAAEKERADAWQESADEKNAHLDLCRERLIAAEAREAALREALERISAMRPNGYAAPNTAVLHAHKIAREALARTAGDTAASAGGGAA
jgi:hypothetical protein